MFVVLVLVLAMMLLEQKEMILKSLKVNYLHIFFCDNKREV